MKLSKLFIEFFESEKAGGFILILCTVVSLVLANTLWGEQYLHLLHAEVFSKPLEFWINDGLMSIFFLLVGLEIEREIYIGELSDFRKSLLPIVAAVGGMMIPALIHFGFNQGTPHEKGFGIPMATDIAFSLGILALVGSKVPASIKVFLTALAIIDDLGAILVIAIFYSKSISLVYLGLAALVFGILLILNRLKVYRVWIYLVLGVVMWYLVYNSGIHATITGVLLAFAIPFGNGDENSPSYKLQHYLHKPVSFAILPLFALANTAVALHPELFDGLTNTNSLGIILGLILGKPAGIFLFSMLGIITGLCVLPEDISKLQLLGIGFIAGIGFTMSIFITVLAFDDQGIIAISKLAVILASTLAGLIGYIWLRLALPKTSNSIEAS